MTLLIAVGVLIIIVSMISYICFRMAFYVEDSQKLSKEEYPIPEGDIYEPFREVMTGWMKETRAIPHKEVSVISFDGLVLRGRFYEYAPGATVELMFHGYRGYADRDLCGGVQRCFALGHSALLVDQRASGSSDGNIITFGVKESRDCHTWLHFMEQHFGPDVKIILTGISMGAATVMMAAGRPLPKTVVGILADCGYTSAKEIIQKVIRQMGLPVGLVYPFVRLGARLYGGFSLEEQPPIEAVTRCPVPIFLIHGENDDFVPCDMSRKIFEACNAPRKRLFTVPGAGHGLGYPVMPKEYIAALKDFFG